MAIDLVNNNDTILIFKRAHNATAQKVGDTDLISSGDSDVVEAINRIDGSADSNYSQFQAFESDTNSRMDSAEALRLSTDIGLQTDIDALDAELSTDFPVRVATFTAATDRKYLVNTTGGSFTCNLPANPSIGDKVGLVDYAATFDTNNLILATTDGENIQSAAETMLIDSFNWRGVFEYMDSSIGWSFL